MVTFYFFLLLFSIPIEFGKALLSLALGFGEVTIPRYLEGQVPSKEYSGVVRAALASPVYSKNRGKGNISLT